MTRSTSLILAALIPAFSHAEEGGGGHYSPGGMASMMDNAPDTPGFALSVMYNYYDGDASASQVIPDAGNLELGLSATANTAVFGFSWLFEPKLWDATVMTGVFVPIQDLEVNAKANLTPGGSAAVHDTTTDIADITLIPAMLTWKSGDWSWCALLNVYAPTGGFEIGALANTGKNYWTFDPTAGVTYFSQKTGFSATAFAGVTMNTKSTDTNYQSGAGFHIDATVAQYLPLGKGFFGIGATGFWFQQISGDSGSGATLGGFEGSTAGLGPVISYILPLENNRAMMAELKWEPELETTNRIKGDYVWLKFGMTF